MNVVTAASKRFSRSRSSSRSGEPLRAPAAAKAAFASISSLGVARDELDPEPGSLRAGAQAVALDAGGQRSQRRLRLAGGRTIG